MAERIIKAIIPIAGLGTRLRPFTYAAPKAMLPLVDRSGRIVTVLHSIIREVVAAGIFEVAVIVSPGQQESLEAYFQGVRLDNPDELPERINYITQSTPGGFGQAVLLGKSFADSRGVLIMLGDHVHISPSGIGSSAREILGAFESMDAVAMVGVKPVDRAELESVGVVRGEKVNIPDSDERIYLCRDFVEKPSLAQAAERLGTPGMAEGTYLAHSGIYAMSAEIYDCLSYLAESHSASQSELEFAAGQSLLLSRRPEHYYLYRTTGQSLDAGTADGYTQTQQAFRAQSAISLPGSPSVRGREFP